MSLSGKTVLYITYDGLLDPLGGSQILPYLRVIAGFAGKLIVLSFEKPERLRTAAEDLRRDLAGSNIIWLPLRFTHGWGFAGKLWDLARMYLASLRMTLQHPVRVVHARGHPPAQAARLVKRLSNAGFLFDFRGFWADERVDKGGWNLDRRLDALLYRRFKRVERKLLAATDELVVLTEAAVPQVRELGLAQGAGITVIPCCADFAHFRLAKSVDRARARQLAELPAEAKVLGYLGSIGRMYLIERVLRLFILAADERADLYMLFITQDRAALQELIEAQVPTALHARIRVRSASRSEVPQLVPAMDVLVSFIQPSWARAGASPTKLAECFAMGVPAICNPGVGDVAAQMTSLDAGALVDPHSDDDLIAVSRQIDDITAKGGARLRNAAEAVLGLDVAAVRYHEVYRRLDVDRCCT